MREGRAHPPILQRPRCSMNCNNLICGTYGQQQKLKRKKFSYIFSAFLFRAHPLFVFCEPSGEKIFTGIQYSSSVTNDIYGIFRPFLMPSQELYHRLWVFPRPGEGQNVVRVSQRRVRCQKNEKKHILGVLAKKGGAWKYNMI